MATIQAKFGRGEGWLPNWDLFCCVEHRTRNFPGGGGDVSMLKEDSILKKRQTPGGGEMDESFASASSCGGEKLIRSFSAKEGYRWKKVSVGGSQSAPGDRSVSFNDGDFSHTVNHAEEGGGGSFSYAQSPSRRGPAVLSDSLAESTCLSPNVHIQAPLSSHDVQVHVPRLPPADHLAMPHPPLTTIDPPTAAPPTRLSLAPTALLQVDPELQHTPETRLGRKELTASSWVVEDFTMAGTVHVDKATREHAVWVTNCCGLGQDPLVVYIPAYVQSLSVFKCDNVRVSLLGCASIVVHECNNVLLEVQACNEEHPFVSFNKSNQCVLHPQDSTPASAFGERAIASGSSLIRVVDMKGDAIPVRSR